MIHALVLRSLEIFNIDYKKIHMLAFSLDFFQHVKRSTRGWKMEGCAFFQHADWFTSVLKKIMNFSINAWNVLKLC